MPDTPIPDDEFPDSIDGDTPVQRTTRLVNRVTGQAAQRQERAPGGPSEHIDLFVAHLLDAHIKDDQASMGAPIYSLATKPDLSIWQWTSADGRHSVKVIPSVLGRATMHDKDLLIYVTSVMVAAMDRALRSGAPMPGRHVEIKLADYFHATGRDRSGRSYENFDMTLQRLKGTILQTNIGNESRTEERVRGFGLIEDYEYSTVRDEHGRRVISEAKSIKIMLSRWLYSALQNREVLTLHDDYWELRKPLEKRLYELARKHCGRKEMWQVAAETLHRDTGSQASLRRFRSMMVDIIAEDRLPEYRFIENQLPDGSRTYRAFRRQAFTLAPLVRRVPKK